MKMNKIIMINTYLLLSVFFIFTNYMYGFQGPIIILLTLFLISVQLISRSKFILDFKDFLFLLLGLILLLSSLKSTAYSQAISYSIAFICIIICMIILKQEKNLNYKFLFNLILIFSSIHVFSTILYQLFPNGIQKILPYILSEKDLSRNLYEFNYNNIICGITPIQGLNALYISSYLMVVFSKLLNHKKNKLVNTILLVFGFISLFFTSKRGLLLANVISIVLLLFYTIYKNNKLRLSTTLKNILVSVFIILMGMFIVNNYFPESLRIFDRFKQNDYLTGRGVLWKTVWNDFLLNHFPNGSGLFSSRLLLLTNTGASNDVHNIYLQILVELGIVGFILFLINITYVLKRILDVKVNEKNKNIIFPTIYIIIVFLIYGFTGNWFFDVTTAFLYYLVIGLLFNKNLIDE